MTLNDLERRKPVFSIFSYILAANYAEITTDRLGHHAYF